MPSQQTLDSLLQFLIVDIDYIDDSLLYGGIRGKSFSWHIPVGQVITISFDNLGVQNNGNDNLYCN